ncbi:MAG TPA: hypothetical protein VMW08_00645 [Acidimicrobiales bacterium]|nr:hypothetical protein [Acidimicrobiales bacterium]
MAEFEGERRWRYVATFTADNPASATRAAIAAERAIEDTRRAEDLPDGVRSSLDALQPETWAMWAEPINPRDADG